MSEQIHDGKILAVDDESMWLTILGEVLEDSGVPFALSENADDAVDLLRGGEFTGVLTDGLAGEWRRVVEAAKEAGALAVLVSGDFRQIDAAEQQGVEAHNKAQLEPNFFEEIIEKLRTRLPSGTTSTLADIFPDNGEVTDELERLTMGYEDFSDDSLATRIFGGMTQRQIDAVHKFALSGPALTLQHLQSVVGLLKGLDARDPERKSQEAVEIALAEIDASRAYFEAINENDHMPTLVLVKPKDLPETDGGKEVWAVRSTEGEEKGIVKRALPEFDIIEGYLREPQLNKAEYDRSFFSLIGGSFAIIDRSTIGVSTES